MNIFLNFSNGRNIYPTFFHLFQWGCFVLEWVIFGNFMVRVNKLNTILTHNIMNFRPINIQFSLNRKVLFSLFNKLLWFFYCKWSNGISVFDININCITEILCKKSLVVFCLSWIIHIWKYFPVLILFDYDYSEWVVTLWKDTYIFLLSH